MDKMFIMFSMMVDHEGKDGGHLDDDESIVGRRSLSKVQNKPQIAYK